MWHDFEHACLLEKSRKIGELSRTTFDNSDHPVLGSPDFFGALIDIDISPEEEIWSIVWRSNKSDEFSDPAGPIFSCSAFLFTVTDR